MRQPFFSIIIPIYNTPEEYLADCIESLLAQSMGEYEIILVDDGSGPVCSQLCDAYADKDDRIRVIHQINQGVSAARNCGIAAAKADWIMFVDADDWIEPDACEKLKEYLDGHDCDMLVFNAVKEYDSGQEKMKYGLENGRLYCTEDVGTRELLYRRAMGPQYSHRERLSVIYYSVDKVYKRSFLCENNLSYPVGLPKSEDKVFILSCFEKLERLFYVDDIFYHYRINSASVCNKFSANADTDRARLALLLHDIAHRMDAELAELTGKPAYDQITRDYYRFIFGIISDVLFLKFYHPDNPGSKKERVAAAKKFIKSEPFKTSIQVCRYSELTTEAKLKKFLLHFGLVTLFCGIRKRYVEISGKTASKQTG